MKRENEQFTFVLNGANIDTASEIVRNFLVSQKCEKREITRYTLSVEEILLNYAEKSEQYNTVTLTFGIKFFMPFIMLEIQGPAVNVYASDKDEQGVLRDSLLVNLRLSPDYMYKAQTNIYQFRLRKKQLNPFFGLIIVLAAAIAVGTLGMLFPEATRDIILTNVLDRLHETFLNILSCLAGPMIFLSVAWGIYGIGDAATLKRIGKQLMFRYFGTVCMCVVIGAAICIPVIKPVFANADSSGNISFVFTMLFDIIPKDIVSPFVNGNTLQIIFMAIIFGIAMLFLGQKTKAVANAIRQINYIIQFIIEFIGKLVPYFVFIVIVSMIWSNTTSIFVNLGLLLPLVLFTIVITQICVLIITSAHNRVSPLLLLKKGLPTLIIGLSTASSAAAFGFNIKACRDGYGIDEKVTSFGIPLGMVIFKPNTSLSYLAMSLFFAKIYGVEISVSWVFVMLFSAVILAVATPPIPGGAMTAYTLLFTQLGIPAEAIAIALACDALFDFVTTGFDQFSLPFCLLNQATRLGMVNHSVLTRRTK